MTIRGPLQVEEYRGGASRPLALLHQVVQALGEITIRVRDLGPDELGRAWWADNMIDLHREMDHTEWQSTLIHELLHLLRGPADLDDEEIEEATVEHLAEVYLLSDGGESLRLQRQTWRRDEIDLVSGGFNVVDPVPAPRTAEGPSPGPRHAVIVPSPRHALGDDPAAGPSLEADGEWVIGRARRFSRINQH